jgi:hypothetical protein
MPHGAMADTAQPCLSGRESSPQALGRRAFVIGNLKLARLDVNRHEPVGILWAEPWSHDAIEKLIASAGEFFLADALVKREHSCQSPNDVTPHYTVR